MAAGVLEQCPICRARLDSNDSCRRCRAELSTVRRVAEQGAALAGAGLHRLAAGDRAAAACLLRRASILRTTPDLVWILSALADARGPSGERIGTDRMSGAER
jgi:hypothetical protein